MLARRFTIPCTLALAMGLASAGTASAVESGQLARAVDINPDPHVLEMNLVAEEKKVDLSGNGLYAQAYTFNGTTPGPEVRLKVGDRVIVHFTNLLPEATTVHWHGVELANASDGTPVTQSAVPTGGTFTYRFIVPRAGIFWYHSHSMNTNPEFKGLYGPIVVTDDSEERLIALGVLPDEGHTRTLVLGDTTVCKAKGANDSATFSPDPHQPWAFTRAGLGQFPGITAFPTPRDLCEQPRDGHGHALGNGALAAGTIPNIQPPTDCGLGPVSCRTNEGQLVLTNGQIAAARGGSPEAPARLANDAAAIGVRAREGFRLRLINAAVSRYFRLKMTDQHGEQITLYRVGGEGGLLDRVRVEGGMQGSLDTKYDRGEILLAPSERADVVLVVPAGTAGDSFTLWTEDYRHYGTNEYPYGYGGLPTVPVAHFRIGGIAGGKRRFRIAADDPVRIHPTVNRPIENLKVLPVTAHLRDPAKFKVPQPGSASETVLLAVLGLRESIDAVHGTALHAAMSDFRDVPHIASSRYAMVGDLLELTIDNATQQHHPLHLHGFSYQPVRITDTHDKTLREFDYNEFVDSMDMPDTDKLVIRVRLDDRRMMDGVTPGGAAGRWMLHCHIFNHADIGMMTELVVLNP